MYLSVCLSVHPFVLPLITHQYCIKMAKSRITQTMPHDSAGTLASLCHCFSDLLLYGGDSCYTKVFINFWYVSTTSEDVGLRIEVSQILLQAAVPIVCVTRSKSFTHMPNGMMLCSWEGNCGLGQKVVSAQLLVFTCMLTAQDWYHFWNPTFL